MAGGRPTVLMRSSRRAVWPPVVALSLLLSAGSAEAFVSAGAGASLPSPSVDAQGRRILVDPTDADKSAGKKTKAAEESKPQKARSRPGGPSSARRAASSSSSPLDVTFITDVAGAEIFSNFGRADQQRLGSTDAYGKLTVKLARGPHRITVRNEGYTDRGRQVEVRGDGDDNSFRFNLAGPGGAATAAAPAAGVNVSPPPGTAQGILSRYVDPKQTEGVTAVDWQSVQAESAAAYAADPFNAAARAQVFFAQGQLAYLRRDYAAALSAFNSSALALPSSSLAYYGLGLAYLAANRPAEAARSFQRSVELNAEMALAHAGLHDALRRQGKTKEARKHLDRARELGYSSPQWNLDAARELIKKGRCSEALKELAEAVKSRPSAAAYLDIGDCHVALKQPLSAAPAYRRAVELEPRSALAHLKHGELMYELREYPAALESAERALALDPSGFHINRARARNLADQAAAKVRKV